MRPEVRAPVLALLPEQLNAAVFIFKLVLCFDSATVLGVFIPRWLLVGELRLPERWDENVRVLALIVTT